MAALLPTILSDDEDEDLNNDSRVGSGGNRLVKKDGGGKMKSSTSSSKKGNASKETKQKVTTDRDNDESEEEEDDDEMDQDFEFGGLLVRMICIRCACDVLNLMFVCLSLFTFPFIFQGEDGISFDALSSTLDGTTGSDKNAWSYKSALALLSSNDNAGVGAVVERTSVASIIAAARSNLRRGRGEEDDGGDKDEEKEKDGSESSSSDSNEDDDESDDDGSSGSGSDSSDDEVDDADKAEHSMESDVLKVQERPQRKKKGKKEASAPVVESQNEEEDYGDVGNDESDQDDDSEEDDELERDDDSEDERKEASKAAAFFDSSHITTTQDSTIDTFSQLGLSRPLLRGVASMGFVSPTPIQASVIPVALAGRDVCASAVTGSKCWLLLLLMACTQDFHSHFALHPKIQVAKLLHSCSRSWNGYYNEVEVGQHSGGQTRRRNKARWQPHGHWFSHLHENWQRNVLA